MAYHIYHNKKIYFDVIGEGEPLLLLHGNTASSNMFQHLLKLYKDHYKVILLDFLGHGKSDRLTQFPTDFWFDQALQVIHFLENQNLGKVNIVGTSGGALVALNVALERPDLVNKVVADSFEGEFSLDSVANIAEEDRNQSKQIESAVNFWQYNHGSDWETIVDHDTRVIIEHHNSIGKFFHHDLSELKVPALLTGSLEDEYFPDIEATYKSLVQKIKESKMHVFSKGHHPAMDSNAESFAKIVKEFMH